MSRSYFLFSIASILVACQLDSNNHTITASEDPYHSNTSGDIQTPEGYKRIDQSDDSFGAWLRKVSLKKDNHVYLYNGRLKANQAAQYAVLDVEVGHKDLQQCADAVMRLRAQYLFDEKRYADIEFTDNNGKEYKWAGGSDKTRFEQYLENVFSWCGTASLSKQLKPAGNVRDLTPGDVFIKGGFPGHAMIVMDVATNEQGKKIFMLAQSYMPAQDIHIVKNPLDDESGPWYEVGDSREIITPEWIFDTSQLKKW